MSERKGKKEGIEPAAPRPRRTPRKTAEVKDTTPKVLPNQDWLEDCVKILRETVAEGAIEEYYINPLSKNVPTLEVNRAHYYQIAERLKNDERLDFDYLVELHGTDYETYMGLYVYLFSMKHSKAIVVKTKLDRDEPVVQSVVDLWSGANWPECEAYDLLGIRFEGHPNLHRIFLGEDWKGHPLRKDYVDNNTDFL